MHTLDHTEYDARDVAHYLCMVKWRRPYHLDWYSWGMIHDWLLVSSLKLFFCREMILIEPNKYFHLFLLPLLLPFMLSSHNSAWALIFWSWNPIIKGYWRASDGCDDDDDENVCSFTFLALQHEQNSSCIFCCSPKGYIIY